MKYYNHVDELAAELIAEGYTEDLDISIPADAETGCLHDKEGNTLYSYPEFKTFYITYKIKKHEC